jgi:hypothetical protein
MFVGFLTQPLRQAKSTRTRSGDLANIQLRISNRVFGATRLIAEEAAG